MAGKIYVPILKWQQSEYQALLRLDGSVKDKIMPLLVVPPVGYDFEERRDKKTLFEHVEKFADRYSKKWGGRKAFVDLHPSIESQLLEDGSTVFDFILNGLNDIGEVGIPILRLGSSDASIQSVKKACLSFGIGFGIRISLADLQFQSVGKYLFETCNKVGLSPGDVSLIFDISAPEVFEPYNAFSSALLARINSIDHLSEYKNLIIAATSLKMSQVARPGSEQTRHEWHLYQEIVKDASSPPNLIFGDYTIESPGFLQGDMRLINPAAKLIYSCESSWLIKKGGAFRDDRAQMVKLCTDIVQSTHWKGEGFSAGDRRIFQTYSKDPTVTHGTLGTWKEAGISHHMTLVVGQLSSFHGL